MKDNVEFNDININLKEFNIKTEDEQNNQIEEVLNEIYSGKVRISKRLIFKVIRLTWNIDDAFVYLPHNVKVVKENMTLTFTKEKKKRSKLLLIMLIALLIFSLIGATYTGFNYLKLANLNLDIHNDGIRLLNVDLDGDYEPDINIDLNGDKIPDVNIDYQGDKKARFNIDTTGDGKADSNLVTVPKDGKCGLNCDIDGDGWPDINIDLDGDGIANINIDTDGDLIPDLNIDISGNGKCDLMCDEDNDGICDYNCVYIPVEVEKESPSKESETTTKPRVEMEINKHEDGSGETELATPNLIIEYKDGLTISAHGLFPDDQPNLTEDQVQDPRKEFVIENLSTSPITYSLMWKVEQFTFLTDHLEYSVVGHNGGYKTDWRPVPSSDSYIVKDFAIAPRTTQKYIVNLRLKGLGKPQDEDQGKSFVGKIEVKLDS